MSDPRLKTPRPLWIALKLYGLLSIIGFVGGLSFGGFWFFIIPFMTPIMLGVYLHSRSPWLQKFMSAKIAEQLSVIMGGFMVLVVCSGIGAGLVLAPLPTMFVIACMLVVGGIFAAPALTVSLPLAVHYDMIDVSFLMQQGSSHRLMLAKGMQAETLPLVIEDSDDDDIAAQIREEKINIKTNDAANLTSISVNDITSEDKAMDVKLST